MAQHTKILTGSIKPIHGLLEDTMDIVLHVDGRVVHTLPPLLLKPGFLTLEYFSGRRVRYVAPFRLMFVLSLLSFFMIHLQLDSLSRAMIQQDSHWAASAGNAFQDADNPADVRKELAEQLGNLDRARASLPRVAQPDLDVAEQALRDAANRRLRTLAASALPPASASSIATDERTLPGNPAAPPLADSAMQLPPVHIAWLPDVANTRLTLIGQRLLAHWSTLKNGDAAARQDATEHMIAGFFGVLPPILFVLMPVFALLLKLVYLFKRRLYIEHLIVALHSHAFLFLSLLLGASTAMLATWVRPHAGWLATGLGWVDNLLWLWTPIYLLLMQKRVYRQAWPITVVKYLFVAWCYSWLLITALIIAFMLGLAH